jgi:syntaxin 16
MYYRNIEINNLVTSINDLAVLFKELSVLVIEQGTILDRIDYNIEEALDHTIKGEKQLIIVIICIISF